MSESKDLKEYRYQLKPDAQLRNIRALLTLDCVRKIEGVAQGYSFTGTSLNDFQTFNSNAESYLVVHSTAPIASSFMEGYVDFDAAQAA